MVLSVDNRLFRIYGPSRLKPAGDRGCMHSTIVGKFRWVMMQEAHGARPDNDEVQAGQGAITLLSEACRANSDRGIAMLRRLVRGQEHAVTESHDQADVGFDPGATPILFAAASNRRSE